MDGEANQNDMTGARGTPPIRSEEITGITPQEQNGLNAPTKVARRIEAMGFLENALVMNLAAPVIFTATARGMEINIYGHMCRIESRKKRAISFNCSIMKFNFK